MVHNDTQDCNGNGKWQSYYTKSDTVKDATIEIVTIIFPFTGHVTGKTMVLEIIVLRVSETAFHNII